MNKWRDGIPSDAIVTDEDLGHSGEDHLRYYGGQVVCESVHPKYKPLIKAAPEMLKALKAVKATCGDANNWHGETREFLLLVDAAIAKAGGRDLHKPLTCGAPDWGGFSKGDKKDG